MKNYLNWNSTKLTLPNTFGNSYQSCLMSTSIELCHKLGVELSEWICDFDDECKQIRNATVFAILCHIKC